MLFGMMNADKDVRCAVETSTIALHCRMFAVSHHTGPLSSMKFSSGFQQVRTTESQMQLGPFLKCLLTELPRLISVGLLDGFHNDFGWVRYQGRPGGEREVTRAISLNPTR